MSERLSEFDPQARPAQIRRRMLTIARLDGARYDGGHVPAINFLRAADDRGNAIDGDAECANLLVDLVELGLLEEWSSVTLGAAKPTFRQRRFKLTTKGRRLWAEEIDPIPGVADTRFGD